MRCSRLTTACTTLCFFVLFAAPALAVPDLQSLGLDPDPVLPGGTSPGPVTLTEPAANDTVITLSASPSNGATVPGTVTVLTGQSQATFQVTDGGVGGQTTIGATLGATSVFHDLTAVSSLSHLVVNEVDYDQPGNPDSGEFLELYNGGPNVDLTHLAVAFVNGATSTEYDRESLAASRCLVSGGYLVIADSPVTPTPGALVQRFVTPNSSIQNGGSGSPDGVALVDTSTHTLLDALSYDGSITAATLDGFPATVSLVEGTATTAVDSSVSAGSLGRSPNGQDTDNANSDWAFNTTASPGSPNGGSVASVPGACPNHAPQLATVGDRSVVAGQTLSFTLPGTDADGDTLTYGASNLPAGATVDPASGAFSWTPSALQVGTYPGVHLTASDGSATAATDITITVTASEMA